MGSGASGRWSQKNGRGASRRFFGSAFRDQHHSAFAPNFRTGGASKWLYVVMLVCIWNAFKFLIFGPVSLVTLVRVRIAEHHAARRTEQYLRGASI